MTPDTEAITIISIALGLIFLLGKFVLWCYQKENDRAKQDYINRLSDYCKRKNEAEFADERLKKMHEMVIIHAPEEFKDERFWTGDGVVHVEPFDWGTISPKNLIEPAKCPKCGCPRVHNFCAACGGVVTANI